jgi:hypothetical protein
VLKRVALTAALVAALSPAAPTLAQARTTAVSYSSSRSHARRRHHHKRQPRARISAAKDLSLRVGPTNLSIAQGASGTVTVRTGSRRSVALRASGLPAGTTATFTPTSIRYGMSSTLTIAPSTTANTGVATITVTGTSRGTSNSMSLSLNVVASTNVATASQATTTTTTMTAPSPPPETTTTTTTAPSPPPATTTTTTTAPSPPPATTTTTTTTDTPPPPATTTTTTGTTPPATIPTHIETWAYDDGCNGGTGASAALVRQWLTYAESNCGPAATKALSDCHASGQTYCTALQYLDTNKIFSQGSVPIAQSAQENWWLHEPGYSDAAHRLALSGYGGGNYLNQTNPGVRSWFSNYVNTNFNSYDGLMMDDSGASLSDELWGSGFSSSQELATDNALQSAHEQMASALTHSDGSPFLQVDNALNVNPNLPTPFPMLNNPSSVTGLIAEGAPESNGKLTGFYPTLLDDMAYVDHTSNDFVVLLSYDSSGAVQSRRVQAATVLLGYSPGHTVSWSDLEQGSSNLAVWPEEGIVPTDPVQTMGAPGGAGCFAATGVDCSSGGHNDLQVAPGVFRREFGSCFNQGSGFGPCAVIMNTTSSPVTVQASWLTNSYDSQVTFNGGDVQSGGTVDLSGAPFTAGTTTVAPDDAMLLSSAS